MHRHLHAILNGVWDIRPQDAQAFLPYVLNVFRGNTPAPTRDELKERQQRSAAYVVGANGSHVRMDADEGMDVATATPQSVKSVAVLPLNGPIVKYGGACSYGMTDYARWLREFDEDSNIAGIVLDVDTPGGEGSGMFFMQDAIRLTRKPVVAIVRSGMAASAGMGIIVACDEVYASRPGDEFGSIGSYSSIPNFRKYWAGEGLDIHEVYATLSTEKNAAYKELLKADPNDPNDEHYKRWRTEVLDPHLAEFINSVKTLRPAMAATESKWNAGQMFSAAEAIALGMVDGYNTLDGAVERVRQLADAMDAEAAAKNNNSNASNSTQAHTAKANDNMNIKERLSGFITGVKSLLTDNSEVTPETVAAANAALQTNGFNDLVVIQASRLAAIEQSETTLAEATSKATEAQAALDAASAELADTKAKLESATTDVTTMAETLTKSGADLKTANSALEAATKEVEQLKARVAELEAQPAEDGQAARAINTIGDPDPGNASDPLAIANAEMRERTRADIQNIS